MLESSPELGPVGFEIALVLDRLLLDVLERHLPALRLVAVEFVEALAPMPDIGKPRGEADRIMDAAVHAHSAERIVDMRSVPAKERAIEPERPRHPLVYLVERDMGDLGPHPNPPPQR